MTNDKSALLKLVFCMTLFGTIGIFVKYITFPSSLIALVRGIIGTIFLLVVVSLKKQKISKGFGIFIWSFGFAVLSFFEFTIYNVK